MNKLQREAVIRTALELLNDVGMEGLTTRRANTALGVEKETHPPPLAVNYARSAVRNGPCAV